jgi:hypothetical protein
MNLLLYSKERWAPEIGECVSSSSTPLSPSPTAATGDGPPGAARAAIRAHVRKVGGAVNIVADGTDRVCFFAPGHAGHPIAEFSLVPELSCFIPNVV